MKKISLFLSFCLLSMLSAFSATTESKQKLADMVEQIKMSLPIEIQNACVMDNVTYEPEQNQVKFYITVDSSILNIPDIKRNLNDFDDSVIKSRFYDSQSKQFIPYLLDADSELGLIFTNPGSDKTLFVRFTVPELEDAVADTTTDSQLYPRLIRRFVEESKSKCPRQVKVGVEMTDVYVKNDYVIYDFSVDDELFPISSFKETKKEMRDLIVKNLFNDQEMEKFVKMIASVGDGLIYNYIGKNTGERIPFIFNNAELTSLIQEHSGQGRRK